MNVATPAPKRKNAESRRGRIPVASKMAVTI